MSFIEQEVVGIKEAPQRKTLSLQYSYIDHE